MGKGSAAGAADDDLQVLRAGFVLCMGLARMHACHMHDVCTCVHTCMHACMQFMLASLRWDGVG